MTPDSIPSEPDDEFVEQLTALDESVAGESDIDRCHSDSSVMSGEFVELADCLRMIDRVRRHSPDSVADLIHDEDASMWIDGGDEYPATIGRFTIRRKLGDGGFGLVFLAFDPELEREVALKVPRLETLVTEKTRQRFLREGKAAASLNHVNIAAVFESGRIGPICYIASAYCSGGSLAELLARRTDLQGEQTEEFRSTASLIATLAEAIQHAHNRGVLHRDLKPSNILFEHPVESPGGALHLESRIVDFGLARTIESDDDQTRTGVALGTPAYMSPEQAKGDREQTGPASDVYSLGAVLYEMLVGRPPFRRATKVDTILAVRNEEPVPPKRINTNCPADLEAICLKCIEKQPARRYQSASELADDLKRFLDGRLIVARSISKRERLIRWCRRNPMLAGLTSAVAALIVMIAAGSTTAAIMLVNSKQAAVDSEQKALDNLSTAIDAEHRATQSEQLAIKALYEARVAHAKAAQRTNEVGRRVNSFKAIVAASGRIDQLGYGDDQRLLLRNVALRTMSLVDLQLDRKFQHTCWPDRSAQRYVYQDPETWSLVVCRTADDQQLTRLIDKTVRHLIRQVLFSPDGRHLAAAFGGDSTGYVRIWRLSDATVVHSSKSSDVRTKLFDFMDDGRVAIARFDGTIELLAAESFEPIKTHASQGGVYSMRLRPNSGVLALHRGERIDLLDVVSGEIKNVIEPVVQTWEMDWSNDGRRLAAACETQGVFIWDAETGEAVSNLKFTGQIVSVDLHPTRPLAMTRSFDGHTRLWDLATESVVVVLPGRPRGFSEDGNWLSFETERWRVIPSDEHVTLNQPAASDTKFTEASYLSFLENGRLMAASSPERVVIWDLLTKQPILTRKLGPHVWFDPTAGYLIGPKDGKLSRWPIQRSEDDRQITYTIGSAQTTKSFTPDFMGTSKDGNVVAGLKRYTSPKQVWVHDFTKKTTRVFDPHHSNAKWIDVTGDGRTVATGTWHGRDVNLWNAVTGVLKSTIPCGAARVKFSPNGRQLVISGGERYTIIDPDSLAPLLPWTQRSVLRTPSPIAFTADGNILAISHTSNSVRLLETGSFNEIATLHAPLGHYLDSLSFTPDGTKLIAGTERLANSIHIWDLSLIRNWLKDNDLDWNTPPLPPAVTASKPIRLDMPSQPMAADSR